MSNKYYSKEFKYELLMKYKNGDSTVDGFCERHQIPKVTLYNWLEKFEKEGLIGLEDSNKWKPYSKELKELVVREYLLGKYSQYEIVRRYNLSSRSVLQS